MEVFLDAVSWVLIVSGVIFCLIGGYGLLVLKGVYTQMHAASLIDTLGAGAILIGLMLQAGLTLVTAKLALILFFILFTTPTATYALSRAAINHGLLPNVETEEERDIVRRTRTTDVEDWKG